MKHQHVSETLTQTEVAAVFELALPDAEPLQGPTRLPLEWSDDEWAELDTETGEILAKGKIHNEH